MAPLMHRKPVNDKAKNAQAEELNKMMLEIVTAINGMAFTFVTLPCLPNRCYILTDLCELAPDMDMFTDARVNLLGGR